MVSIFSRPLSYRPVNEVCGLIRFSRTMPSASKALRSKWIGRPNELVPRTTVSISERIGQPTAASVTPSSASSARWPSAVPPPWLPIAATTNGSNPSHRTASTAARAIAGIRGDPPAPDRDGDPSARGDPFPESAASDGFNGGRRHILNLGLTICPPDPGDPRQ